MCSSQAIDGTSIYCGWDGTEVAVKKMEVELSDELKTIKFQLMLSPSEAEAIDDWGFQNRIRTRAESIRRLCQIGLTTSASVTPIAHDVKDLAEAIRDKEELFARYVSMNIDNSETGIVVELSKKSVSLYMAFNKLFLALRELNSHTHALRNEGDIDDILKEMEKNVDFFRKMKDRMDTDTKNFKEIGD